MLLAKIHDLETENLRLQNSLGRKYNHCKSLAKKLADAYEKIRVLECKYYEALSLSDCTVSLEGLTIEYQSQSGEIGNIGTTAMKMSDQTQQEIMGFSDQDAGWTTSIGSGSDATMDQVAKIDASLGSFMERPLRIASYTWPVNQPLLQRINPWKAYFDNPAVQRKLDNFKLARCKLHVKAVISGTGFHYGRILMAYNPFDFADDITVDRLFLDVDLIQLSQKPRVFLNPTTNQGGEMCLPFFYNKNYVDLTRFEFDRLGSLDLKSTGNLLTTNDNFDAVVITLYAWTEDLTLTMPTETLVSQSGRMDEFGMGIISKPASAVAKAAGILERIPLIAPYARATEMVASATAGIAQLFGYSRPPIVSDIQIFKPYPQGNLANVDAPDATQGLGMDSKTELTIDSRTVGLDGVDQMAIKSIVTRESYLTSFQWSSLDTPESLLWNCRVTPSLYGELGQEIHMTPMCHMAQLFRFWRGSIKFRFQVVCSDFHKGRMVVSYDPNGASVGVNFNTKYNRLLDLATDRDFEIIVGWGQAEPFLNTFTPAVGATIYSDSTVLTPQVAAERWNGTLQLNVVNRLVSPATDAPVRVNVYVSMTDDYKFGEPTADNMSVFSLFPRASNPTPTFDPTEFLEITPTGQIEEEDPNQETLESQSGEMGVGMGDNTASVINEAKPMEDKPTDTMSTMDIANVQPAVDHTYDVFFGESPQSIRDLCKRYVLQRTWGVGRATSTTVQILRQKDLPLYRGDDPSGTDGGGATDPTTFVNTHPIAWFTPCYAGWRGSLRRKYYFEGDQFVNQTSVVNRFPFIFDVPRIQIASITPVDSRDLTRILTNTFAFRGFNGSAAAMSDQNRCLEIQLPFYASDRFRNSRQKNAPSLTSGSHLTYFTVLEKSPSLSDFLSGAIQEHVAAGEDFTLFFYTGVPIYYRY